MPAVSSSSASPFEAIGFRLSSPPIQMEAKGFVMGNAQSAHEILRGALRLLRLNQESTSSLVSSTATSIYEFLRSVKAIV